MIKKSKIAILLILVFTNLTLFAKGKNLSIDSSQTLNEIDKINTMIEEEDRKLISQLESDISRRIEQDVSSKEGQKVKEGEIEMLKTSIQLIENTNNNEDIR